MNFRRSSYLSSKQNQTGSRFTATVTKILAAQSEDRAIRPIATEACAFSGRYLPRLYNEEMRGN
jgi:hypothetical protein